MSVTTDLLLISLLIGGAGVGIYLLVRYVESSPLFAGASTIWNQVETGASAAENWIKDELGTK